MLRSSLMSWSLVSGRPKYENWKLGTKTERQRDTKMATATARPVRGRNRVRGLQLCDGQPHRYFLLWSGDDPWLVLSPWSRLRHTWRQHRNTCRLLRLCARISVDPSISRSRIDSGVNPARRGARIRGQYRRVTRGINAPRDNALSGAVTAPIIRKSSSRRPCYRRSSSMPIVRPPSSEGNADRALRFRSLTAVSFSAVHPLCAVHHLSTRDSVLSWSSDVISALESEVGAVVSAVATRILLLPLPVAFRRVARRTK